MVPCTKARRGSVSTLRPWLGFRELFHELLGKEEIFLAELEYASVMD